MLHLTSTLERLTLIKLDDKKPRSTNELPFLSSCSCWRQNASNELRTGRQLQAADRHTGTFSTPGSLARHCATTRTVSEAV